MAITSTLPKENIEPAQGSPDEKDKSRSQFLCRFYACLLTSKLNWAALRPAANKNTLNALKGTPPTEPTKSNEKPKEPQGWEPQSKIIPKNQCLCLRKSSMFACLGGK